MDFQILLAQEAASAFMISWWKMILMILPFAGWGWLISAKVDKDARHFHLNHELWNSINLGAGVAALCAMLFIPIFWAGWPVGVFILVSPLMIYLKVRNENVPEGQQFHMTGATLADRMELRRAKKASKEALVHFTNSKGKDMPSPMKDDPHYAVHMLTEDILTPAIDARATRVDIVVTPKGTPVGQIVDGVRQKREPISTEDGAKVFDYIKSIAGLNVEERRKRQFGTCSITTPNGKTKLSITASGSSSGYSLRVDFDLENQINKPVDALGLLPSQLEVVRAVEEIHDRHGIVLIGASRGHGLTTTCYSMVGRHDAYISNIKTLEREIQLLLDGPDQVLFDQTNPDVDYATNLQSILRRDPDLLLTDEIQDVDSAQIIAESGLDGPLIYVPQVQSSIIDQIRIWVKLVGDVQLATKCLRMVINQRLLRTLCANCRQPYKPTPEQLKKLNLPAAKVTELFKAGGKIEIKGKIEGCPICAGTGYMGQTGVFEILSITPEIRKILGTGDLKAALAHARRNKMIFLQEAALNKVVNGVSTIEEVIRISAPKKKPGVASEKR
ncbi:MAG: ATPase, T2SS/T4P/T4SS family [Planctomycetota bacterium]|nr:ATPase, T2SS/T4P/T4SS family [Planctomycetota bacterium]